jgi:Beta-1,3-glucanase
LQLSITNNTGVYDTDQIYFYIIGLNSDGCFSHVESDGTLTACSLSDNKFDGYTDYSINLADTSTLTLPQMTSGQIYVAIGEKLKIKVVSVPRHVTCGLGLALPSGWTSTDPNFNILYAVIEFTYDGNGLNCDTTYVDMFSIPIEIQLIGQNNQSAGALIAGGRSSIFEAFKAASDFAKLVIGDDLRVIAPGHGIEASVFDAGYLDSYIDSCWSYYQNQSIDVQVGSDSFTGQVNSDSVFQFPPQTGTLGSLTKPSTKDVFFCDGTLSAPNNDWGAVVARIAASLNRGVLTNGTTQPVCDADNFYATSQTNHYSQILHANSVNGLCYGFAFDDVCGLYSSDLSDPEPTNLNLTLTPF